MWEQGALAVGLGHFFPLLFFLSLRKLYVIACKKKKVLFCICYFSYLFLICCAFYKETDLKKDLKTKVKKCHDESVSDLKA